MMPTVTMTIIISINVNPFCDELIVL